MSYIEPIPNSRAVTITRRHEMGTPNETFELPHLVRPKNWPSVMAWPPARYEEALKAGKVDMETLPRFQAYFDAYADRSVKQAKRFNANKNEVNTIREDRQRGLRALRRKLPIREMNTHEGLAWAFMLDPNGDFRGGFDQSVRTMGDSTLTTLDGGKMDAGVNTFVVYRNTDMTARIAIDEAKARGWTKLTVSGSRKNVEKIMALAKASGIEVEGQFTTRLVGIGAPLYKKAAGLGKGIGIDMEAREELMGIASILDAPTKKDRKPDNVVGDVDKDSPEHGMV